MEKEVATFRCMCGDMHFVITRNSKPLSEMLDAIIKASTAYEAERSRPCDLRAEDLDSALKRIAAYEAVLNEKKREIEQAWQDMEDRIARYDDED